MKNWKRGVRVLGVAESFAKKEKFSWVVGVVMKPNLFIDGVKFVNLTVGGLDGTEKIIKLIKKFNRNDIRVLMFNGCVISWFNIISLPEIYEEFRIPLVCVTYNESEGLEKFLKEYFPSSYKQRLKLYLENGPREKVKLKTGKEVFLRFLGLNREEAVELVNLFTVQGKKPEPLRVANLIARELRLTVKESK